MIAVGIDSGKGSHEACFRGADGRKVCRPLRFATTAGGVRLLLERLTALDSPATIALEASGHDWLGLQRALDQHGFAVQVINPLQTHGLRTAEVRKLKTDPRDALVVADLVRIGRARANYGPDDTILPLRALTRFRWTLVDQIGDATRRIRRAGPRVPRGRRPLQRPLGHQRPGVACPRRQRYRLRRAGHGRADRPAGAREPQALRP